MPVISLLSNFQTWHGFSNVYNEEILNGIGGRMKRLILTATAVLLSTLTLWAQTGATAPAVATPTRTESTGAHPQRHRKHHTHRHHPHHHTGINARR
jgi:hypothetical protein